MFRTFSPSTWLLLTLTEPLMIGRSPLPYVVTVTLLALRLIVQVLPRFRCTMFPVPVGIFRVCLAVASVIPSLASLPPTESK